MAAGVRLDGQINARKIEAEFAGKKLERLWQEAKEEAEREDRQRMVELSGRTRETMQMFLRRATERKIDRLSRLITESFRFLLRKQTLVEQFVIGSPLRARDSVLRRVDRPHPKRPTDVRWGGRAPAGGPATGVTARADADADIVDVAAASFLSAMPSAATAQQTRPGRSVLGPGSCDMGGKQLVRDSSISAVIVVAAWRDSGAAQTALRVVFGLSRRGTYRWRARGCLDESFC